ncbi:nucleotidyltransferase family protein [Clostridium sp.]|uniref:nucleotidyltransferase family protein n=1 Tax=Clostridium sp. TaxID=1506 RepID=UPI003F2F053D
MNDLLENLEHFIDSNLDKNNEHYISTLKKMGIDLLLKEKIKEINTEEYLSINLKIFNQIYFNTLLENELVLLLNKAREKDINIIPLKGIILAKQLYKNPGIRRSGDIDILINFEDLDEFMFLCKKLGYKINNEREIDHQLIENAKKEYFFDHHLIPIYIEKIINTQVIQIFLEVHVSPIVQWMFEIDYNERNITKKLIERCTIYDINNQQIKILNIYDNIIFLAMHCYKHYIIDIIYGFKKGIINSTVNLSLLHDIAILIKKNTTSINWNYIIQYVEDWKCELELAFIFKIINHIYKSIIPKEIIYLLINKTNEKKIGFSHNFCKMFIEYPINDLIFNNAEDLTAKVINKSNSICENVYSLFEDKKQYIKLTEKTYFRLNQQVRYTKCINNTRIQGNTSWNKEYLRFVFNIEKKITQVQDIINAKDKICLYFVSDHKHTEQACFKHFCFNLEIIEKNDLIYLKIKIFINNQLVVFDEDQINYTIIVEKEKYQIKLNLSWNLIELKPNNSKEFRFAVTFEDVNSIFTWSNIYYPYFDITTYGKIQLLE